MKRILALVLTRIMVFAASAAAEGTLRVGMECDYAPFNWTQTEPSETSVALPDGTYADGYDVQIALLVAEGLGMELEVVKTDWTGLPTAVMSGKIPCENKKTVCIVSGGNIDVNILSNVIERGLINSGRLHNIRISLPDRPGQLNAVTAAIAENGGNVITVHHERGRDAFNINGCSLEITIETKDAAQIEKIDKSLRRRGYTLLHTNY